MTACNIVRTKTCKNKKNALIFTIDGYGDDTNADYYKITNYKEVASTFTCCGWSKMSDSSRVLGYIAAVGGFAGFLKALLASIPPHHHAEKATNNNSSGGGIARMQRRASQRAPSPRSRRPLERELNKE